MSFCGLFFNGLKSFLCRVDTYPIHNLKLLRSRIYLVSARAASASNSSENVIAQETLTGFP